MSEPVRFLSEKHNCMCKEYNCINYNFGYPWCRPCGEHHRPPECDIDSEGFPLDQWGGRYE